MKLSLITLAAISLATITGCSKSGGGSENTQPTLQEIQPTDVGSWKVSITTPEVGVGKGVQTGYMRMYNNFFIDSYPDHFGIEASIEIFCPTNRQASMVLRATRFYSDGDVFGYATGSMLDAGEMPYFTETVESFVGRELTVPRYQFTHMMPMLLNDDGFNMTNVADTGIIQVYAFLQSGTREAFELACGWHSDISLVNAFTTDTSGIDPVYRNVE